MNLYVVPSRRIVLLVALVASLVAPARPQSAAPIIVPFDIVDGHIFVDARINGAAPVRLAVDTGAADLIATDVAASLKLRENGRFTVYGTGEHGTTARSARVATVQIGDAVLRDQHFTVMPFDELRAAEGAPRFDGLIGHELFDRYTVRIDYEHRTLTLSDPRENIAEAGTLPVPLHFRGTMPAVEGNVDGLAGQFTIDTGDRGSLSLLVPFVVKHGLERRYQPTAEGIAGWGIGGPVRAKLTRVHDLRLGNVDVRGPVTRLPQSHHGFFAGGNVAGNVGYGVLRRFTLTFDYAHRRVWLVPNADAATPDVFDRSGMWLVEHEGGLVVADVIAGGPAADAGLKVGDVVTSVEGRPVSDLGLSGVRQGFRREPVGTRVPVHIVRNGTPLDLTLTLRDLV